MNRWDSLLAWLYERESSNWQNVKKACSSLSFAENIGSDWPPRFHAWHWMRPIFILGHAELCQTAGQRTVDICPSGIVWSEVLKRGFLYGYWPENHTRRLRRGGLRLFRHVPRVGPTCWSVTGSRQSVESVASESFVWFSEEVGEHLLCRLPNVEDFHQHLQSDEGPVSGSWEKRFFRDQYARWVPHNGIPSEPGFYQRKSGRSKKIVILDDGKSYQIQNPDQTSYANWFHAPATVGFKFVPNKQFFLMPKGAPKLPTLIERGLTLASGRLPVQITWNNKNMFRYCHISSGRAKLVASLLNQHLQIEDRLFNDEG